MRFKQNYTHFIIFLFPLATSEGLIYDYDPQVWCQARHQIREKYSHTRVQRKPFGQAVANMY